MIYINNSNLVFTILEKLVNNNMRGSIFPVCGEFTEEEIASIDSLTLTEQDNISEINKLTNLKSLTIVASKCSDADVCENNYEEISRLKTLETLSIINVRNIKHLNVAKLRKLKVLKLVNNESLEELIGVSELKNLEQVVICGNDISKIDNPKDYIDNTSNCKLNILDINMFFETFYKEQAIFKYLEEKVNTRWTNIKFGEMLKFDNECYVLEFYEFLKMFYVVRKLVSAFVLDNDTDFEKAFMIYKYIVNNVKYDYDGLNYRDALYYENKELIKQSEYLKQRILLINSSYSAIINGKAVCDGYMNMMKFALGMCNIKSKKVLCSVTSNSPWKTDHVIIKFKDKETDAWFYCDPEKQQKHKTGDYFGLTIDQISETHTFPYGSEEEAFVKLKRKS